MDGQTALGLLAEGDGIPATEEKSLETDCLYHVIRKEGKKEVKLRSRSVALPSGWSHLTQWRGFALWTVCQKAHERAPREGGEGAVVYLWTGRGPRKHLGHNKHVSDWNNSFEFTPEKKKWKEKSLNCEFDFPVLQLLDAAIKVSSWGRSQIFLLYWLLNNTWLLILIAGCIYFLISAFKERLNLFRLKRSFFNYYLN